METLAEDIVEIAVAPTHGFQEYDGQAFSGLAAVQEELARFYPVFLKGDGRLVEGHGLVVRIHIVAPTVSRRSRTDWLELLNLG